MLGIDQKRSIIYLLIIQAYAGAAFAQESQPGGSAIDRIVVQAQRATEADARAAQEEAPNIVNVITTEEMRKLPDVNVAEAVSRLPAISLETDTGEGRYVNIRGLDANLNSVTFGGLRLPPSNTASSTGGSRAVALDAIPTGLVGAITVTKTNLPEQDAEALGGTIEITPKTMPLGGKPFLDLHVGTGKEPLRATNITDLSVSVGTRFGGGALAEGQLPSYSTMPFSVVLTASYYEDTRGIDDVEPAFIDDGVAPSKAYDSIQQRHYTYNRKRHGQGIDLGYQPNRDNSWYLRAFDAGYREHKLADRLTITTNDSPTFANGVFTDTIAKFDKVSTDEHEEMNNRVIVAGGKNLIGDKVLDYHVGMTRGSYVQDYSYGSDFKFSPAADATITYDSGGSGNTPRFTINNADYLNPANYKLTKFSNGTQNTHDKEKTAAANLKMPVTWGGFDDESLKVGLSARSRNRDTASQPYSFANLPKLALAAYDTGGNVNFYDGAYNNGPNINTVALEKALADLQTISASNATSATLASSTSKEDVYATYAQYHMARGNLQLTGGARLELTHGGYDAYGSSTDAKGNLLVLPVSGSTSYSNFFPSLQARYELMPRTLLRAVFSSTIGRPGFNQLTPSVTVNAETSTVNVGNPDLKPTTGNSFDLSFEHYLADSGIISIGLFDKELKDYIAKTMTIENLPTSPLYAAIVGPAKVTSWINLGSSYARGVEVNYEQRFKGLPQPFGGLGVGFNYTAVDSQFKIRPGEDSLLPTTARNIGNVSVFYEKKGLNLKLAAYYVSRSLYAIGDSAALDTFSEPQTSVDFGGSYAIDKHYSMYFNVKNLTNTPLTFSEGSSDRVIQREFYGRTYQIGLNVKL
jgi:TonB-dependent receptor